jgi:hypothetical protein
MMESLEERFQLLQRHVTNAVSTADGDGAASPVLKAVVRELAKKKDKAFGVPRDAVTQALREAIIEVEQAADSAKAAAEADPNASAATKRAVEDMHMAFCMFKADVLAS